MTGLLKTEGEGEGSLLSLQIASFGALFLAISFFLLFFVPQSLKAPFATFAIQMISMESTRLQFLFYGGVLVVLAGGALFLLLFPSLRLSRISLNPGSIVVFTVFFVTLLGHPLPKNFLMGFLGTALFLVVMQLERCREFILNVLNNTRFQVGVLFCLIVGIFFYSIFFLLFPLTIPLGIASSDLYFFAFENHYSISVLPGFYAALGEGLGFNAIYQSTYGLGVPLLMASLLKFFSLMGLGIENLVLAVKSFQLIALFMIACILIGLNRRTAFYTIPLTWGAMGFTLSSLSTAIFCPNQSGIRYIPFLLGVFLIMIQSKKEKLSFFLLAAFGALALMLSPETGLAILAGILVFVALKSYQPFFPVRSLFFSLGKFSFFFCLSGLLWFFLFLKSFYKNPPESLFAFLKISLQGYGGLVQKPNLIFLILFFFATSALFQGVLSAREGKVSWVSLYRASVGAMMLAWMPYYVNRMNSWNLWFQVVLVLLLIIPFWNLDFFRKFFEKKQMASLIPDMLFLCFVGGQLFYSGVTLKHNLKEMRHHLKECSVSLGNGTAVPPDLAQELQAQWALLPSKLSQKEVLLISGAATSLRLSGWNQEVPWYDISCNVLYESDEDRLIEWLNRQGPQWIYADSPDSAAGKALPIICAYFLNVLDRTKTYQRFQENSGWVVFKRRSAS